MELQIDRIENAILKSIAKENDNGDKVIKGEEIKIFLEKAKNAVKQDFVTEEEFKETLGFFAKKTENIQNGVLRDVGKQVDSDSNNYVNGPQEINGFLEEGRKAVDAELCKEEDLQNEMGGLYVPRETIVKKVGVTAGAGVAGALGGCSATCGIAKLFTKITDGNQMSDIFSTYIDNGQIVNSRGEITGRFFNGFRIKDGVAVSNGKIYNGAALNKFGILTAVGLGILAGIGIYKGVKALFAPKQPLPQ